MDKKQASHTAEVLHQAFPYLKRFQNKYVAIKLGGSLINQQDLLRGFAQDVSLMRLIGMYPVLIHGGGKDISSLLKERGIETHFEDGMRVTNQEAIAVVEEALASVNQTIVSCLESAGGKAAAFSKAHHSPVHATVASERKDDRLGAVHSIDTRTIMESVAKGAIPVLSPIGRDTQNKPLNINADAVAGRVASALKVAKFMLLTDVAGIRSKSDTLSTVNQKQLRALIEDGTIIEGMLPKAMHALEAIKAGIPQVHIIDGRIAHAVLLEIFTEQGVGTMVTP